MDNFGKTIQVFLPDGSPRGIKIAEVTSRTVKVILIPRNKFEEAGKRQELSSVGVYFLFGEDETDAQEKVYIGEAENLFDRLKTHNRAFCRFASPVKARVSEDKKRTLPQISRRFK